MNGLSKGTKRKQIGRKKRKIQIERKGGLKLSILRPVGNDMIIIKINSNKHRRG